MQCHVSILFCQCIDNMQNMQQRESTQESANLQGLQQTMNATGNNARENPAVTPIISKGFCSELVPEENRRGNQLTKVHMKNGS